MFALHPTLTVSPVRLFWNQSLLLKAFGNWLHANQHGHLLQKRSWKHNVRSPPNVLSVTKQLNYVSLRNACNSLKNYLVPQGFSGTWADSPDFHSADFLFTVMSTDCHPSPSYSQTKWNFHFLVCKGASPPAFVWYLFIQFMWQEQYTLINISAFTSL